MVNKYLSSLSLQDAYFLAATQGIYGHPYSTLGLTGRTVQNTQYIVKCSVVYCSNLFYLVMIFCSNPCYLVPVMIFCSFHLCNTEMIIFSEEGFKKTLIYAGIFNVYILEVWVFNTMNLGDNFITWETFSSQTM